MADNITMITAPDDLLADGFRMLLVDLDREHDEIVSRILVTIDTDHAIIAYIWKSRDSIEWLLDKRSKINLIIFNANSQNQTVVGYMAAQPISHYFSDLRDLNKANSKQILDLSQCQEVFENSIGKYERSFK